MKLEEVNQRTKEAVDFLVAALESGHSEVLTRLPLRHGQVPYLQLWQHPAYRTPEGSDMMLYLAGVSKYRGLRVARCYQWGALAWSVQNT
jgi:hypothetical protein